MKRICRLLLLTLLLAPALSKAAIQKNHCTAHQYCPNGTQISCTGHGTCSVGSTSVTCDGVTTDCPAWPPCPVSGDCSDPQSYCDCVASGVGSYLCWRAVC